LNTIIVIPQYSFPLRFVFQDAFRPSDVIFTVSIVYTTRLGEEKKQLEIDCLGSNTLEDLSAYIYCVNDTMGTGAPGERDSYFHIEGRLYIESDSSSGPAIATRHSFITCVVEEPIAASSSSSSSSSTTLKRRGRKLGNSATPPPSVGLQNATRIEDLPIHIGKKYYFYHCPDGACEHLLYFSDMRLPHKCVDLLQRSKYPRLRYQSKMRRRLCGVCEISSAQVIVFGDKLCIDSPTLLCNHCYDLLHRTADGTLIYDDYLVFPYSHDIV
jgi:snRNA-activating protein complex subunit 3